jgi:DNA-directed RNA polymerase subunit omega
MPHPQSGSMIYPKVERLMAAVDSKFKLVTLSSKRARQINSYFGQLGDGLGAAIPPQVTSVARKPLSIAFEEIAAGKIRACPLPEEDEATDEELALVEAVDGEGDAD